MAFSSISVVLNALNWNAFQNLKWFIDSYPFSPHCTPSVLESARLSCNMVWSQHNLSISHDVVTFSQTSHRQPRDSCRWFDNAHTPAVILLILLIFHSFVEKYDTSQMGAPNKLLRKIQPGSFAVRMRRVALLISNCNQIWKICFCYLPTSSSRLFIHSITREQWRHFATRWTQLRLGRHPYWRGDVARGFNSKNDSDEELQLNVLVTSCMCTVAYYELPDGTESPEFECMEAIAGTTPCHQGKSLKWRWFLIPWLTDPMQWTHPEVYCHV